MTRTPLRAEGGETGPDAQDTLEKRIRDVGSALHGSLLEVLDALPGAPHRPNQLARDLDVNRAVASRVLNAVRKRDPLEALHVAPGPEPLRRLVRATAEKGVDRVTVDAALSQIDRFDRLIRDEAGTRPALDALISSTLPGARERFELASKYSVYKGMSQLKGAQAECWVGTAIAHPSATDAQRLDLTWLNGAVAMRRLRPGATVRFSYRARGSADPADAGGAPPQPLSLDSFCHNPPARLASRQTEKTIHYTLPEGLLGPREVVDTFVVDHHPAAMRRFSTEGSRRHTSLFVEPALPVAQLVFDTLLHDDAFPGAEPHLLQYDTGYDGMADVNDPERDIDRVDVRESVEFLGRDMRQFQTTEVPKYAEMLAHLAERFGWEPSQFRGYRTRIQYPVYGWQVCMAFEPPVAR